MSLHGLMKYPVAESTGVAHAGIDSIIAENQIDAQNEQYKLHGAVGPNPAYDEEGNIRIDEGWAPDIALAPFMTGKSLLKYASGVKPFVKKIVKDPKELKRMANRGYRRAILHARSKTKRYLNTNKPYQQARQKFQEWDQPTLPQSDPIMQAADKAKWYAIDDIAGKKGLDRFFHTIGATDSPMNNPRVREAIRETMAGKIMQTDVLPISRAENIKEFLKSITPGLEGWPVRGRAWARYNSRPRVELARGQSKLQLESTGKHEFGHVGRLQGPRNAKWAERMHKNYDLTGDELNWIQGNVFDRPFSSVWTPSKNPNRRATKAWEDLYMEKIYPHLKPDVKKWYDKYHSGKIPFGDLKGKEKLMEYQVRPREIAERASQMRHEFDMLKAGDKSRRAKGGLLEKLLYREDKVLTEEGINMALNKLWGLGPVGIGGALGLSFQEGKAKK
jgi:hypothetical protein